MAYKQLWGSVSPGHIVYLVDLSGSMVNKIDYTISVLQSVFRTLVACCAKGNTVSERLSVSVIGYNSSIQYRLHNLSVTDIARKIMQARKSGTPIFNKNDAKEFKPQYQTFMRLAFDEAKKDINQWISQQRAAGLPVPAPIVINITDGSPYEGNEKTWEQVFRDTTEAARSLMNISTEDGNVRLFNIHHYPKSNSEPLIFPSHRPSDPVGAFMFDSSSEMDEDTLKAASNQFEVSRGSRCMVSNISDPSVLLKLIEFGSTTGGGLNSQSNTDGSYF